MGQQLSCSCTELRDINGSGISSAIQNGELEKVRSFIERDPKSLLRIYVDGHDRVSALHLAASSGQIEILSMLLDHDANPDLFNRHKQTPLMLAAMHGKISCLEKLIQAGANMLMFDSIQGRTCLHYAALYGHSDCLQVLLSSAHSSPVAASWGFNRFVNIRDKKGSTPLHLAARQRHAECVHILLGSGALVSASTGGSSYCGSTPLHFAARGGSLDCVRELLAHGADRLQRDSAGRIPYMVALKYKHTSCAALLNPSSAEPLVWPSSLKVINELNPDAKSLLEKALIEANKKREKSILKEAAHSLPPPMDPTLAAEDDSFEDSEIEVCCICFEQACTIQVEECGHQMCAHCTLALCCQNSKPSHHQISVSPNKPPLCPFCRSTINKLIVARINKIENDNDAINFDGDYDEDDCDVETSPSSKPRRSKKYWSYSEGSSSFKGLSAMGSLGKMVGIGTGKIAAECSREMDKAVQVLYHEGHGVS
ncbi:hypothetical protein V2J09_018913 [Rumex salicifolius]